MVENETEKRHSIFISHFSQDARDAEQLAVYLQSGGLSCWIAPRDIPKGNEFAEQLVKDIDECDLMLVLLTEHVNHSQHVIREINHAVDRRKAILPVRMGDLPLPDSMKCYLSHTQWLAFPRHRALHTCLVDIEKATHCLNKGRSKPCVLIMMYSSVTVATAEPKRRFTSGMSFMSAGTGYSLTWRHYGAVPLIPGYTA